MPITSAIQSLSRFRGIAKPWDNASNSHNKYDVLCPPKLDRYTNQNGSVMANGKSQKHKWPKLLAPNTVGSMCHTSRTTVEETTTKVETWWTLQSCFASAFYTHTYIYYIIYIEIRVCVWHMLHKSKSFKKTTYEIATSHHSWTFTERSLLLPTESKSLGSTAKLQASCLGMAAPRYRHGFDANPQDFPLAMANLKNQHIDILR